MNMDLSTVVTFTNITDEPFTHLYGGVPYTVNARESQVFPADLGKHLAKHLARKILYAEGEAKRKLLGYKQDDPKNDVSLFSEKDEQVITGKILGQVYREEVSPALTPEQVIKKRVEELNPPKDVPVQAGERKQVIAELEQLGVIVDKRKSLATLVKDLEEAKKV